MKVIFDANAIVGSNWGLDSAHLETILSSAKKLGMHVLVPAVVIEEVCKNFSIELRKEFNVIRKGYGGYARLTRSKDKFLISKEQFEEEVEKYRSFLVGLLSSGEADIIGFPTVGHDEIVWLDIEGKKPFKENGAGYRDALIWYSVVEEVEEDTDEETVFITANKSDFFTEANGALVLHEDLADILENRGLPRDAVVISRNLGSFVEQYVRPLLQRSEEIEKELLSDTKVKIDDQIAASINSLIMAGLKHSQESLGFDDEIWVEQFYEDTEVLSRIDSQVQHLEKDHYLFTADVIVKASFEIETSLYSDLAEDLDGLPDFDQRSISGTLPAEFSARISLVWDEGAQEFISESVSNWELEGYRPLPRTDDDWDFES